MSFLKNLFGRREAASPEAESEKNEERQFNLLRDNGVRAMQLNEVKLAVPYFEKALELRPDDLRTVGYLAEALLKLQDYEAALPRLERLSAADADNLEVHLLLAQAQGRTGRFDAMRDTAAALLATHADDARVPYLAGVAAHGLQDEFSAIAFLTQAIAQREDYGRARLLRARILAGMGQWTEVLADTAALTAADPDGEEALLLHADALAATADGEGAEAAWRHVLEVNPFSREAYLAMGRYYEASGRADKALALYDEAVAEMPDFAEAFKQRGGVKLRLKDTAGAADDLKRALELRPELGEAFDGEFSNLENRMNDHYRSLNPYHF